MSEFPLVSETPFGLEGAAARTRRACLFLTTNGAEPCGVEIFTRKLVAALAAGAPDAGCELMPISGSWRDLPATMLRIARAHKVVFSAPLLAWKRMLVQPLLLLLFAFLFRRRVVEHDIVDEKLGGALTHPVGRLADRGHV